MFTWGFLFYIRDWIRSPNSSQEWQDDIIPFVAHAVKFEGLPLASEIYRKGKRIRGGRDRRIDGGKETEILRNCEY